MSVKMALRCGLAELRTASLYLYKDVSSDFGGNQRLGICELTVL